MQFDELSDAQFDARHTALIVVDMQNDFCHDDGHYAQAGRDISHMQNIVGDVNRALTMARDKTMLTIFTTLIYDSDHPPIEERHRVMPVSWLNIGPRLARGSWGSEVVQDLPIRDGDIVLAKHAYSSFEGTNLNTLLRERNITTVVLCGVVTNVCVLATAFDAFDAGYDVCVFSDAVAGYDEELCTGALGIVDRVLGRVVKVDALDVRN